jgi:hypothetical protein
MALNITSSARSSAIYSVMGGSTPAAIALPKAGPVGTTTTVSYLAIQDLTGAVSSPSTNTGVQLCSPSVGIAPGTEGTPNQKSDCTTVGSVGTFPVGAVPDPECSAASTSSNPPCTGGTPAFMLNRVDIAYQFTPPIPSLPFAVMVLISPACTAPGGVVTCTFYRHSLMRVM